MEVDCYNRYNRYFPEKDVLKGSTELEPKKNRLSRYLCGSASLVDFDRQLGQQK
jgi:hypothetical protein